MKQGIYQNFPRVEYDKVLALNFSGMKSLKSCPADFMYDFKNEKITTAAMLDGLAFHWRVFEEKKYLSNVKFLEGRLKTTKKVGNDIYIHPDKGIEFENMYSSIKKSEVTKNLLSSGCSEVTIFWNDPEMGIPCKARLDWINEKHKIITDLKTTADARLFGFTRSVVKYKYYWQAYWYKEGMGVVTGEPYLFWFLCIEGSPYYHFKRRRLPSSELLKAENQIRDLKFLFRECLDKDSWPGWEDDLEDIILPGYV